MQRELIFEKIEKEAEKLTLQEQLKLIEKLAHKIRKTGNIVTEKYLEWSQLYGLGKGLWKNEDAQEYVNKLRQD